MRAESILPRLQKDWEGLKLVVSNGMGTESMRRPVRFRLLLPIVQTIMAGLFGGVGLWERNRILCRPFLGNQTLWESTARFHVWPWPFKFAVISNLPAFLAGSLLTVPIGVVFRSLLEAAQLAPSLLLVAILWYWVGSRLDRRWRKTGAGVFSETQVPWIVLFVFTVICLIGAFLPLGYAGYLPYASVVWLVIAAFIRLTRQRGSAISGSNGTG